MMPADRPEPPPQRCPKCGDAYGFLSARPRYTRGANGSEDLRWACSVCGYVAITPTADAPRADQS